MSIIFVFKREIRIFVLGSKVQNHPFFINFHTNLLKIKQEDTTYLFVNGNNIEVNETAKCAKMQQCAALHHTYYVKRDDEGKPVQDESSRKKSINGVPYKLNSIPPHNIRLNRLESVRLGIQRKGFKELVDLYHDWNKPYKITAESDEQDKNIIT